MQKEKIIKDEILEKVKELYEVKFNATNLTNEITAVRYAGRVFDEKELMNLVDSSLDFWLTAGRYADEFESRFANLFEVSDAILVNSGSSANLIAVSTLTSPKLGDRRLRPGDEVITVASGCPTSS